MKQDIREGVRKSLMKIIFERQSNPYWITRGTVHRYGFDGASEFQELVRVEFNDTTNEFDAYLTGDDEEEYIGSSGDLTKIRSMALDVLNSVPV